MAELGPGQEVILIDEFDPTRNVWSSDWDSVFVGTLWLFYSAIISGIFKCRLPHRHHRYAGF